MDEGFPAGTPDVTALHPKERCADPPPCTSGVRDAPRTHPAPSRTGS